VISRDKLPKRWEDLLNPVWKGRMLVNPREQWFAWILQVMGKENGLNYMRGLAKQNVGVRRESGAPVNWTTLGPTLVVPVGHGLSFRAPHSNAAKLFIDFVLSREGQQVVLAADRNSARSDLAQEQAAMKDARLVPLDPSTGDNMEFYARQAQEIFGK
jgi:iron(III) transport system substrate-binding protein